MTINRFEISTRSSRYGARTSMTKRANQQIMVIYWYKSKLPKLNQLQERWPFRSVLIVQKFHKTFSPNGVSVIWFDFVGGIKHGAVNIWPQTLFWLWYAVRNDLWCIFCLTWYWPSPERYILDSKVIQPHIKPINQTSFGASKALRRKLVHYWKHVGVGELWWESHPQSTQLALLVLKNSHWNLTIY